MPPKASRRCWSFTHRHRPQTQTHTHTHTDTDTDTDTHTQILSLTCQAALEHMSKQGQARPGVYMPGTYPEGKEPLIDRHVANQAARQEAKQS